MNIFKLMSLLKVEGLWEGNARGKISMNKIGSESLKYRMNNADYDNI